MKFDMTFEIDWLKKWARYSPRAVAFKDADSGVEYTYASLYYLTCRLAAHLESRFEIKRGDRVAVLATNELEYIALFFSVQRLGAILVPMNFRLTGREVTHLLRDSSPELLILQRQFQNVLESVESINVPEKKWWFDGSESLTSFVATVLREFHSQGVLQEMRGGQPEWALEMRGESESVCKILYTSGTTGAPKGAMITNSMLHWNSINTTLRLNINQTDVSLCFAPFFHTGGWNVLLTPFVHRGARTILIRKFDPERILNLCASEGVTVLFGVPTMMDFMAKAPSFHSVDLSTVRYAIVGGEPMSLELIKVWQNKAVPIRQGFGLTEFGPGVFSLNEEDAIRKIGSIGFPNFYIEARIVDESGQDLSAGEIGELALKGPVCMAGYWNNPQATADAIKDGWFFTGDLVRTDEEGYHYVVGRKKDMFKSGGENVYPIEIEQVLSTHPSIREVAVIGVPDSKWGEVGKVFVSLNHGANLSASEITEFCTSRLAKFKIPKYIEFMTELPKGDSGKILKRMLKELETSRT